MNHWDLAASVYAEAHLYLRERDYVSCRSNRVELKNGADLAEVGWLEKRYLVCGPLVENLTIGP